MIRKIASLGLALSVVWAVISLVVKGGVGVSRATVSTDFNFTSATAQITHETASTCLNSTFVSCAETGFLTFGTSSDSDSYGILANLAIFDLADFQQDLNQSIEVALAPGNCTSITSDPSSLPIGTWIGFIPGASLHKVTNKNFTTYNFDGNIPTPAFGFEENATVSTLPVFDGIQFNLKIPATGTGSATMSLQGNANLCSITGPMALAVYVPDPDSDIDFSCVTIPAPEFDTLDISSVCPQLFGRVKLF